MIKAILIRPGTKRVETLDADRMADWMKAPQPGAFVWANCVAPDAAEDQSLQTIFEIDRLAMQDAQRDRHPAKYEAFESFEFLLMKDLAEVTEDLEFRTLQCALFLSAQMLVTRCSEQGLTFNEVWNEVCGNPAAAGDGAHRLALLLLRRLSDRYHASLVEFEASIEELERDTLEVPSDRLLTRLSLYRTNLKRLRRVFVYHEQAIGDFRQAHKGSHLEHQLTDVAEQFNRITSLAALHHDIMSELADSFIAMASHRLNGIMKILTVVTVIFVPLSFMAGIYGMNFEYMPELSARYAYFTLVGVMIALATTLIVVFRIKRWI